MRLRNSRRGQVLIHVLVSSVVVAIIAASLMRLVMMRVTLASRMTTGSQGKKSAEASYQLLLDDWASNGVCNNPTEAGNPFTCPGGVANTCGCACSGTVAGILVNVTTSGTPGNCAIALQTEQ